MKVAHVVVTLLVGLCLASGDALPAAKMSLASDAETSKEKEREVLRLEEVGRQKFLKGESHWDDLMADGAYMVRWDGVVVVYQAGQALPAAPMKSLALSDMIARAYGDVVVVTGMGEGEGTMPDKKPFSFKSRFLNVWRLLDGRWKIAVTQNTAVRPQQSK